jgi:MFS family permease
LGICVATEWYDFFLYGTASAIVFPEGFFPNSSSYSGTLESFATCTVGFAARPVGAAIFGHWGDRLGRRATLIITLLMTGIASALVGVLPGVHRRELPDRGQRHGLPARPADRRRRGGCLLTFRPA